MIEFIRDAGFPIYFVFAAGAASLAASVAYAQGRREVLSKAIGLGLVTLLLGCLGTVIGVQVSARHIGETPEKWIFLIGLAEASNNLVAALTIAVASTLIVTLKATPRAFSRTPDPALDPRA